MSTNYYGMEQNGFKMSKEKFKFLRKHLQHILKHWYTHTKSPHKIIINEIENSINETELQGCDFI